MGAIINSKEDLSGWTLYVSIPPCSECARYIIMAGIKRIVYKNDPNKKSQLDYKTAKNMFKESNVILQKYGGAHD